MFFLDTSFHCAAVSSVKGTVSPVTSSTCQSLAVCFGVNEFRKVPIYLPCSSTRLGACLAQAVQRVSERWFLRPSHQD